MIQRQSHTTVFVLDQAKAIQFYTETMGFEIRSDFPMGGNLRWVTVSPKGQPDLEIVLAPIVEGPMFNKETASAMLELVKQGAFGIGVFATDDCHGDYEKLKQAGVRFQQEPKETFYGIEAIGKDNSGNWFSLTQHKK